MSFIVISFVNLNVYHYQYIEHASSRPQQAPQKQLDDGLILIPENSLESALDENITYQPDRQPFSSISADRKSMIHVKKLLRVQKKWHLRAYH